MLVAGKDTYWDWLLAGCCFCECVGCLIETPWDVIELEAIELVVQLVDFSAVCSHLDVVAA